MEATSTKHLVQTAALTTVGDLFHSVAAANPSHIAIRDGDVALTYALLERRSNCLANFLTAEGLVPGDRIAVLARNRFEYFEILLAAAKAGVIVAALNWRLLEGELGHCVRLVSPRLILASHDLAAMLAPLDLQGARTLIIDREYERTIADSSPAFPARSVDPESGLVILYTSGTTGLPKGALISHRAMIARGLVYHLLMQVPARDNFIAWTPFYHMVSTDHGLATLLAGGTVWCVDGYQPELLIDLLEQVPVNWFVLVPGMVAAFNGELRKGAFKPRDVRLIGAMADLVPGEDIAEATRLFNAPFLNSFGATETGLPPATGARIAIGEIPARLSKTQSPFCDLRLLDAEGAEVPVGEPGEAVVAGPTLFSGYWNNDETNQRDFRDGRFHMGDVLRRNQDGTLDYVDRVKYMIKSGGENIYPAEIESVIGGDPRVATAIVVRKRDARWGEVPVLFVVRRDDGLGEAEVMALCRQSLAGYKIPRQVFFIGEADIPRSTTGKVQRHVLEERLRSDT